MPGLRDLCLKPEVLYESAKFKELIDESSASPDSKAWSSTHINMHVPRWTAEEIKAYVDGLGSPDVYWASFGYYPTTYEPMLRAAFDELVDARAAAEP